LQTLRQRWYLLVFGLGGALSSRRKAFASIYISVALSYLGVGLVAPLISIVLFQHGIDSFQVGLVGTTTFAAFTVASFPIGTATDRVGTKPILICGLVLYGVSILLFAFIKDIGLFFLMRAIEGIGGAAVSVATETAISQLSRPDERARRMSYYGVSVGAGWALGPLAGASMFQLFTWLPFVVCCGFSLIAAGLVAGFVPQTKPSNHQHTGIFAGFSSKIAVPLSAGTIYGFMMSSLVTLFPLYLKKKGIDEVVMGTIITSVIIGTILSQVPVGHLADYFGKRRILFSCGLLLTGLFVLLPLYSNWWYYVVLGTLLGAVGGNLYPVGLAMLAGLVSKERLGSANSLFSLAFGTGSLIGPALSGLAMNHLGDGWLFYLPSILCAAFSLELVLLYSRTASRRNRANSNSSRDRRS